ncbi:threonine aldolase [Kordiimonas sediminis]|uniref:Threonine aldolase n=1 Tax=Kordiimonas sediminis TaxID=1735581 RepID=A0A919AJ70_9PROT|nr:beta-eliminating lyase-related protein [Kordiimonas sediminis]GHF11129.1 threonine aldolase [Kordiimonas sediminis]
MYHGILLGHPLMAKCEKFVTRHKPLSHSQWISRMQGVPEVDLDIDFYGQGHAIAILDQKMADILGREKALFFHKDMVGQHSVLLSRSRQSGKKRIAVHPQSHMQVDEALAYSELLGLEAVMFGKEGYAVDEADIAALSTDLSSIVVELPTRRAGFKLPDWQVLEQLKHFSKASNIPLHFDGARLFEASCYYGKSYDEVAAMADSVYVSLYKTLGAAAGGIVAGDADFIDSLVPWRTRLGGDLFTAFPYVLTALWGLDHYLPRIPEFHQSALSLSASIRQAFGENALPEGIQCSGFQVELPIAADLLEKKALAIAEKEKVWLFDRIVNAGANASRFEIQVGDALDDWTNEELVARFVSLVE